MRTLNDIRVSQQAAIEAKHRLADGRIDYDYCHREAARLKAEAQREFFCAIGRWAAKQTRAFAAQSTAIPPVRQPPLETPASN
jgi:hypothetical protein